MPAVPPVFTEAELAQARRLNRQLRWAPRFRAPTPLGRFMIQSILSATQNLPTHAVRGVRTSTMRIEWRGHSVSLRILRPARTVKGAYIDYHGGGWAIGNAAMDDRVNALIARDCHLVVVSVDYTTLPDITLPGMIDQCHAAADWVFEHGEALFGARELFIGGESAGAHLAACALQRLRDEREDFGRMRGAVLFYGPYDLSATQSVRNAPRDTIVLDGPAMRHGIARLLPGRSEAERRAPDVSPLYAKMDRLPPGLLLCGAIDPLIDDSRLMAEQWPNAQLVVVPEAPHAFNRFATSIARRTNAFVRSWINDRLVASAGIMPAAAE